jgi:hypothetical protein
MIALDTEKSLALRKRLLNLHAVSKCCEIPPNAALPVDLPPTGLLRVALYRLDGKALSQADVTGIVIISLGQAVTSHPSYLCAFQTAVIAGGYPWPMAGFLLKPAGSIAQAVGHCEALVISEYAGSGCGSFQVLPLQFEAQGVPYLMYTLWALDGSLATWGKDQGRTWKPWLQKGAAIAHDNVDLSDTWTFWFSHWVKLFREPLPPGTPAGKVADSWREWADFAQAAWQPGQTGT